MGMTIEKRIEQNLSYLSNSKTAMKFTDNLIAIRDHIKQMTEHTDRVQQTNIGHAMELSKLREHINSRDNEIKGLVKAYNEGDTKGLNNALEYLSLVEKKR